MFSPSIDRGEAVAEVKMTTPRVGGNNDGVAWTGGSNLDGEKNDAPTDVLCFRPENFKEMQKQHECLKKGLPIEQRLELGEGSKISISLITWITWMMIEFTTKGMDTIFKILQTEDKTELDLVQNWGKATKEIVQAWVVRLKGDFGDKFDRENLRLSGFVVRGSLGPHLLARVISLAGADASGPELFLTAVFQVSYMTASLVRSVSNQIGNLKLNSVAGENVAKLGEQIVELVKQIECSGSVPEDLLYLVTKPYVTGTQETFRTYAQQIYTSIISGDFKGDYHEIVHKMNNFYQNLLQSDDYEPAKGGIKESEASVLQGMIAKLTKQMDHLQVSSSTSTPQSNNSEGSNNRTKKCYLCNGTGHSPFKCPNIPAWRTDEKPKDSDPKEKKVDNVTYKYCAKCRRGDGFWTSGNPMHTTAEHKGRGWNSKPQATTTTSTPEPEAGLMGIISEAPMEVDFP